MDLRKKLAMTDYALPSLALVLPGATPEIEALREKLQRYSRQAAGAYAANTFRAWSRDVQLFWHWCQTQEEELSPLPATPDTVEKFVAEIGAARKTATIRRYLASIAKLHRVAELPDPTKDLAVKLALRTLQRTQAVEGRGRQRQAKPINYSHLEAACRALGERPIDHFTRALVSVAYECLCRAEDLIRFDVAHLLVEVDGTGRLTITQGKTDQTGEGKIMYLSATTVRLLHAWLACCPPPHNGALFRPVFKSGTVGADRISYMAVARAMRRAARAACLEVDGITGHSCRVGAAQDLLAEGFSLAEIMEAGRWTTERMPARYTENLAAARGGMAQFCKRRGR